MAGKPEWFGFFIFSIKQTFSSSCFLDQEKLRRERSINGQNMLRSRDTTPPYRNTKLQYRDTSLRDRDTELRSRDTPLPYPDTLLRDRDTPLRDCVTTP